MIKFIFIEIKKNLKLFILSFIVLLMLITSNINLLCVSASIRTNIYDSLNINVGTSVENNGYTIFKECDLSSNSYEVKIDKIKSLTEQEENRNYPLINNNKLPRLHTVNILNSNNRITKTYNNIFGSEYDELIQNLESEGTKYKETRNKFEGNLFFYNQDGFYKSNEITKYKDNNKVLYLNKKLADYLSLKDLDTISFTSTSGSYEVVLNTFVSDEMTFYLTIESIDNIDTYLETGYRASFSLIDIHDYEKAVEFISTSFNYDEDKVRSEYVEDYITLSNIVILVLLLISLFILVLNIFVLTKMIRQIIDNRKSMIGTLSILGISFNKISLVYFLLISLFLIITSSFAIGFNFLLDIFISDSFLLTFNIDYIYYFQGLIIPLYIVGLLLFAFIFISISFIKLRHTNMYYILKEGEQK